MYNVFRKEKECTVSCIGLLDNAKEVSYAVLRCFDAQVIRITGTTENNRGSVFHATQNDTFRAWSLFVFYLP